VTAAPEADTPLDRGDAPFGCVDIGSNTTRLLVARVEEGRLRELMTQRAYTRLGKSLRGGNGIPAEKIASETEIVATQVRHAREIGVARLTIVATAAIRKAANRDELVRSVEDATGLAPRVLTDEEEARLAFLGASRTLTAPLEGSLAVVDVGGGSSEIAVGTLEDGVEWSESFSVGSGFLADAYLHSDPPAVRELNAVRQHAIGCFEGLVTPPIDRAVASGGSATALRRLAGAELSHDALERAIRVLATAPAVEVAERFELDIERVRLLPAGVLILEAITDSIGQALKIGNGGLREGCIIELAAEEAGV
jgi:exopolyphosphatase / guanosine-5'-triphosphate,3'-diphosphate pyrophosphatase